MNKSLALAIFAWIVPLSFADSGGFTNSGGSLGGGSPVSNPAGTLTISGGNLSFVSTGGGTVIQATFSTSSTVEGCSGGGKGGHITCSFTFTGQFTGTLTVNGAAQAINGSTSGPFSQTNTCSGSSIASGASCTIQVTFTPTATGSASGSLTITDDAGAQTVALTGSGSAPVSFSRTNLGFGQVAVGNTSAAKTVTVTNRLNVALTFSSIAATGPFAIASNTCGTGIAAGANCAVGLTFTPAALGPATGVLTFTDSANTSPQTVNLSGTGAQPVVLSTSSLSFNSTVVGTNTSARSVTVTNLQIVTLNFTSIAATGSFTIASNTCGPSIAAGATCTVGLTFTPATKGPVTATLTFTDSAGNSPQVVSLSGSGQ